MVDLSGGNDRANPEKGVFGRAFIKTFGFCAA
jgi:hypothetical protein